MKISCVNLFINGNVMVFDEAGNQVISLQGRKAEVIPKLEAQDLKNAEFWICDWYQKTKIYLTREQFFDLFGKEEPR